MGQTIRSQHPFLSRSCFANSLSRRQIRPPSPLPHSEREEQHERHHQAEQAHGLRQCEAQDRVREELLLHTRVARVRDDQRTKDVSDARARSSNTNSRCACSHVLCSRIDIANGSCRRERTRNKRGTRLSSGNCSLDARESRHVEA